MKTLDKNSTEIFCELIKKMNGREHIKIEHESFMPLSIERLFGIVLSPIGEAEMYSVMHTYVQMGDLMKDPEMCFLVFDKRTQFEEFEQIKIIPCLYQQDNLGIYEEGIVVANGITVEFFPSIITEHVEFAQIWLGNIKQQGFLTNTH